jgi:chaperonin GroES
MTIEEIIGVLKEPWTWWMEGDRIAILKLESEDVTTGGIIIPDTAKEDCHKGIILALGEQVTHDDEGFKKRNCPYTKGAFVVYGKYAGSDYKINIGSKKSVEVMVMRVSDITFMDPNFKL